MTMRALARASSLKLGAMQNHFPTWEELLQALAEYVSSEYRKSEKLWEQEQETESPTMVDALR